MNANQAAVLSRFARWCALGALAAGLAGCSYLQSLPLPSIFSGNDKPKPAELQPNPNLLGVRQS